MKFLKDSKREQQIVFIEQSTCWESRGSDRRKSNEEDIESSYDRRYKELIFVFFSWKEEEEL